MIPNGVTTDFDGNYLLNVKKEDAILVFSYLGFETQKISLANQSVVNVILKEDLNSLEEVQVVAFSKQKKSSVIGSVSTINTSDLKLPSTNLTSSFANEDVKLVDGNLRSDVLIVETDPITELFFCFEKATT